jgi:hypothetical protein
MPRSAHSCRRSPGGPLSHITLRKQAGRIQSWLLELVPARGCRVRREPVVEIVITGHEPAELHPPLLRRVEEVAGCRFGVAVVDG